MADWDAESIEETQKIDNLTSTPINNYDEDTQNKKTHSATDMNLHYNIQIHLPETTNMAVYDAIFQSLKKHLM